jgi:GTP cyclohydrolase III
MSEIYLAVDGDDVGSRLEYLMLINESESLTKFSRTFEGAMIWLEDRLINEFGALIIFRGGDNLLARLDDLPIEVVERLRIEFSQKCCSNLSVGLGKSTRQAYFALKLAKTSGKDCIRHFKEIAND